MQFRNDQDSEATKAHRIEKDRTREQSPSVHDDLHDDLTPRAENVVEAKLRSAREAATQGDQSRAEHLLAEVNQLAPDNSDAWLSRAAIADTNERRLAFLS